MRAHLEAVHLQATLVIDIHILLLGSCKELLIVQKLNIPDGFFHLNSQDKGHLACMAGALHENHA